jgi:hypothetical protein
LRISFIRNDYEQDRELDTVRGELGKENKVKCTRQEVISGGEGLAAERKRKRERATT